MIFVATKLTTEDQILDAIKKVRTESGSSQNKAFRDLTDTYKQDLEYAMNSAMQYATSENKLEMWNFVLKTFSGILLAKTLEYDTVSKFEHYFRYTLKARINKSTVRSEIEFSPAFKGGPIAEYSLSRGLSKFHILEHKEPDFEDPDDVKRLAEIMKVTPKRAQDWIDGVGTMKLKSIYEQVSGGDDEDKTLLLDSLKSNQPLPDQIYHDKQLAKIFEDKIRRILSPAQYDVFNLFYHFTDPDAADLTMPEIVKEVNLPFRRVKYLLDDAKAKIFRNPEIREWAKASQIRKLLKHAHQVFQIKIVKGNFKIIQIGQVNENIINEVVASYGL